MKPGDTVLFLNSPGLKGELLKLPRSEGRRDPRCLVRTTQGVEMWVKVSELEVEK
jgi:hypothetical protein